jgi:hypothetical protein
MPDPSPTHAIETKIEAGILSLRFDGGYWNILTHGVKRVTAVIDLGDNPRRAKVEWVNEWGLSQSQTAELRAPKRLS